MARDRKRAKQRRDERARHAPRPSGGRAAPAAPDPVAHATAEVEEFEAAVATGGEEPVEELRSAELEEGADGAVEAIRLRPSAPAAGVARSAPDGGEVAIGRAQAETADRRAARREPREGPRVIQFLQACWAELQRVQWPDRRHVVQATSVVLGFVIIAGVYLGVLDEAFSKLVDAIL